VAEFFAMQWLPRGWWLNNNSQIFAYTSKPPANLSTISIFPKKHSHFFTTTFCAVIFKN
jgi:hypothetical protein